MTHDEDIRDVDTTLEPHDELFNLFSSFDEVSASDELKEATLSRILALAAEDDAAVDADPASAPAASPAKPSAATGMTAIAGGKAGKAPRSSRRSKWRAIRIAAVAACLAMALSGGIAYATPASYYEIEQDGTTITLGVNCFGITVNASSGSDDGLEIIEATDLRNLPYEDAIAHAIEAMESRNPDKPVEFGPQGGEHEVANPQEPQGDSTSPESGQPQDEGQPADEGQPQGERESAPQGEAPSAEAPAGESGQPGNQAPDNRRG